MNDSKRAKRFANTIVSGGIALAALLAASVAQASSLDYTLGAGAISYPASAAVQADLGYGLPIWGQVSKDGINYGYVRPGLSLLSAGLVNRGDAYIDFYPITFLGFRLGHTKSARGTNFPGFDCSTLECRGSLDSNYAQANLLLGYGPAFLLWQGQASFWSASREAKPFLEESSSIPGKAGSDTEFSQGFTLGTKLGSLYTVGGNLTTNHFVGTGSRNLQISAFVQRTFGGFKAVLGSGRYESTIQSVGWTSYVAFQWIGAPAIGLQQ